MESNVKNKQQKENIKKILEYVIACQQFSPNNADYQFFTNSVKELSGAVLVGLNLLSEENENKTTLKAISGDSKMMSLLKNTTGHNLERAEWEALFDIQTTERNKLTYFSSFKVNENHEKILLSDGLYVIEFDYQGEFLGTMTLIMPSSNTIEDKDLIELYINQIAGTIKRLRAEERLQQKVNAVQESKNQLAITLDSIGDGVIVTDISGKITRMNPQAEKLTGWLTDEVLGRDLHEVFHINNSKTGETVPNPVYRVIETGTRQGLEDNTVLIARDGSRYNIADSAAPIKDDEDNMFGVIMVFSDVTKRKNAEESLKYQFRFEKMLAGISSTFASQSSEQLDHGVTNALEQIGEFFQVDRSYVFQFSDDGEKMSNTHEWCAEGIEAKMGILQDLPVNEFPWRVGKLRNKEHVYITGLDNLPPEAEKEKQILKSQGIYSLLSIPMIKNGLVFGFLGIDTVKEKTIWSENHMMLLTVVVDLVSHAYTRNLAEEKVRYQSFHDGLTGLFNRVYLDQEMERLDTERQLPIGIIMVDLNNLKLLNDTFGHLVGDEMLMQTAEILKHSCRSEDIIARWGGDEFMVFLPQTSEDDVKAICQRVDEKCKETYVKDIPLSLATGYAIKHNINDDLADTQKEAEENMYKHKLAERQQVKNNVISVMLKTIEAKSFESEAHIPFMQNIGNRIGERIGLSKSELDDLNILISLHDIGVINIPEEILTKESPLIEEEWDIIKKHPETGYRIVRASEGVAQVAEGILSHHEHWDGSGYPQGLKGKEIPLRARITSIADAYEAMSTGRSYKKAMSRNEIIAELKKCAGHQFDPELIELFLHLTDKDNSPNNSELKLE